MSYRYGSSSYNSYSSPRYDRSDSRRDSGNSSTLSSYRRDSGASRYGEYTPSRYSSRYDTTKNYESSRFGDYDKYSKYKQPSIDQKMADEPKIEEEVKEESQEVLQESDVEQFSAEPETVIEYSPENVTEEREEEPSSEPEEENEAYPEPEPEPEEEELAYENPEPEVVAPPSPPVVSPQPPRRTSIVSPNENQNPDFGSPKKLGGGVWPPREENAQKQNTTEEGITKKRVSDLIARFNSGNIDNEGPAKADQKYKQEYGAGRSSGKVQQSVFQ